MRDTRIPAIRSHLVGRPKARRLVVGLSLLLATGVAIGTPLGASDLPARARPQLTAATADTDTGLAEEATLVAAMPVGPPSADLSSLRMDLRNAVGAAVWLVRSGQSWQVHAAERLASREWGAAVPLSVPGTQTEAPVVDVHPDEPEYSRHNELVLAAWRAFDGRHWRVEVSLKQAGLPWTTARMVSGADADAGKPVTSIVEWGDGTLEPRVVWRRFDLAGSRLQVVRLDPDGTVRHGPDYFTPSGSEVRDPDIDSEGDQVIWTQFDGRNWRLVTDTMAFIEGSEEPDIVSPPGEDVSEPSMRWSVAETAYAWVTGVGEQTRVRVVAGGSAGPSIGSGGGSTTSGTLSPAGLPAQAPRIELLGAGKPMYYREYPVAFWRQFDGRNWRIATRGKPPGKRWQPLEYLSSAGVDASLLVTDSAPSYPYGPAASAAWLESTSPPALRTITLLPDRGRKTGTLLEDATGVSDLDLDHANTLGPGFGWIVGGPAGDQVMVRGLDVLAPTSRVAYLPVWTPRRSRTIRWDAADDWSPTANYTISRTGRAWSTGQVDTRTWRMGTATSTRQRLRAGYTYCFAVRSTDAVRHAGDPSRDPSSCTTTPVDDREFERCGAWRLRTGAAWYRGTYLATRRRGASLTLAAPDGRRIYAILLATGPGHGRVRIEAGDFARTVSLDTADRRHRVVEPLLYPTSPRVGKSFVVTVLSKGRPVRVYGAFAAVGRF